PERMEEQGISWKVYQNELYKQGLPPQKEEWLDNFGDNTLENFKQYHVSAYNNQKYNELSSKEKALHDKAFCTNKKDPNSRDLTLYTYKEGEVERQIEIRKGNILFQFREDVKNNKLPTVSWLVPPGKFSD